MNLSNVIQFVKDPNYRFKFLALNGAYNHMPDDEYLKRMYRARMGKELNLDNPRTLNEKLQWLKIHDHNPLYPTLVDKYAVKQFVAKIIGEEHIIPTIAVWDRAQDMDFSSLPNKFVLKCTHDSHDLVICKDKTQLDTEKIKRKFDKALKREYYLRYREWAYKDVQHRIIAEQYLEDDTGFLTDYKFYCFNGKADCVLTCFDRMTGDTKFYFFDREWNLLRYNKRGKEAPIDFTKPKPANIDLMFEMAETLAKASEAPFIRADFYNVYGKVYFGELTIYPAAGYDTGRLPETDILFGDKLDISSVLT